MINTKISPYLKPLKKKYKLLRILLNKDILKWYILNNKKESIGNNLIRKCHPLVWPHLNNKNSKNKSHIKKHNKWDRNAKKSPSMISNQSTSSAKEPSDRSGCASGPSPLTQSPSKNWRKVKWSSRTKWCSPGRKETYWLYQRITIG